MKWLKWRNSGYVHWINKNSNRSLKTEKIITFRKLKKNKIMDGKTKAIVAHITWIGWLIALVLNSSQKDEITSFYIRQLLGIYLFGMVISLVPVINLIGWIATFVFWLLSLISAINGEIKEVPIVGHYFQDWFKGI